MFIVVIRTGTSRPFMGTIGPPTALRLCPVSSTLLMMTRKDYLKLVLCTLTTTVYGEWTGCGLYNFRNASISCFYFVPLQKTEQTRHYAEQPTLLCTGKYHQWEQALYADGCTDISIGAICPILNKPSPAVGRPYRTTSVVPTHAIGSLNDNHDGSLRSYRLWTLLLRFRRLSRRHKRGPPLPSR